MTRSQLAAAALLAAVFAGPAPAAPGPERIATFSGDDSAATAAFRSEEPWLLSWSVASDAPRAAVIRIRLVDVDTGRHIGDVVDFSGIGSGTKLFRETGRFRFDVSGRFVRWVLHVERTDTATAQAAAGGANTAPARLHADPDDFAGWSAVDARTLQLIGGSQGDLRIRLRTECPGLTSARRLSFVTAPGAGDEAYDSILLEDGTRCYFDDVQPWIR